MDRLSPPAPHPAMLPLGTVVGDWRVEAPAGRGVHGTVYRAVPLHAGHALPGALKLALHPGDPRFEREVHLLSLFRHRVRTWGGWPWLTLAATGSQDAGTRGLGEAVAATSMEQAPAPSFHEKLADEPLPEPQPGQTRPNAKGQCPRKGQTALNKGCWLETGKLDSEGCAEFNGQMFKGLCYLPVVPPGRRPTSSPTDKP